MDEPPKISEQELAHRQAVLIGSGRRILPSSSGAARTQNGERSIAALMMQIGTT